MSNMTNAPEQFAAAVCPQCGGQLKVEPGQKFVECPYCHTISRTVDVHYHQHQNTNYSFSGSNTTVQFNAGQDLETLVKNAETHMKLSNYDNAKNLYKKITEEYPHDYRGWWGLILSNTKNLSDYTIIVNDRFNTWKNIKTYWKSVKATAPQKIKEQLLIHINEYDYSCKHELWWQKERKQLYDEISRLISCQAAEKSNYNSAFLTTIGMGVLSALSLLVFLAGVFTHLATLLLSGVLLVAFSVYKLFIKFDSSYSSCIIAMRETKKMAEFYENKAEEVRRRINQTDSQYRRPVVIFQ